MGVFSFFKKSKVELTDEQKKWNKMWDLWVEGRTDSPYSELMTYQSEINNGGHDQYFFNIENSGNLQKEMAVLKTVLPAKLRDNMMICFTSQKFSFPNTVVQYIARSTLSSDISDGICAAAVIIIKRLLNFV